MAYPKRKKNILPNGRREKEPFIYLSKAQVDSPSWMDVMPIGRCILIEMLKRYNGQNNGDISLSYREAQHVGKCGADTARRALDELQTHGWIRLHNKGAYQNKHASTWILTIRPYNNQPATNDWRKWTPEKNASTHTGTDST